ncbi:hypothetical protein GCM10010109_16490 [Actinoplanes campanulatus]|nr:hypothetical protein GCM10010109_16490 [Actinoplanes campanulatus]
MLPARHPGCPLPAVTPVAWGEWAHTLAESWSPTLPVAGVAAHVASFVRARHGFGRSNVCARPLWSSLCALTSESLTVRNSA